MASTKSALASVQDQGRHAHQSGFQTLNVQISDLQSQNQVLDQRATDFDQHHCPVERANRRHGKPKLAIAETNNVFIQGELKKSWPRRAELERKFNDLNEVRAQVRKLKDELFVARRLQLDRYTNGTKKGGALLIQRTPLYNANTNSPENYNLNVEVGSDGSVKVITPPDRRQHQFTLRRTETKFPGRSPASMPTYEYICKKCGHEFETSRSMAAPR